MRKVYNKLIRDRIPEIIQENGKECSVEIMDTHEYRQALLDKLIEEANEIAQAEPQDLTSELADIYEVLEAIESVFNISKDRIQDERNKHMNERGGFLKRIRLLWVD